MHRKIFGKIFRRYLADKIFLRKPKDLVEISSKTYLFTPFGGVYTSEKAFRKQKIHRVGILWTNLSTEEEFSGPTTEK